ncbi:MAG: phosphohistidine phosphatase SixA [Planctomycetota bacterium]
MLLFIARHAWAGHFGDPGWPDDSLRELTPDGIVRYRQVVQRLAEQGFAPERIASSPYVRCQQTAQIIADELPGDYQVEELPALQPGADLEALLEWTASQASEAVCWVGHNPDVEWMTESLVTEPNATFVFKKGSVAAIEFAAEAKVKAGQLLWHATAKSLGV